MEIWVLTENKKKWLKSPGPALSSQRPLVTIISEAARETLKTRAPISKWFVLSANEEQKLIKSGRLLFTEQAAASLLESVVENVLRGIRVPIHVDHVWMDRMKAMRDVSREETFLAIKIGA